jgi:putative Holliday junction resolvase
MPDLRARAPSDILTPVTPRSLLGIDYGEKRIGVAASDGSVAVPVAIVEHTSRPKDLERIADLARERGAEAVVVGLPLLSSGEEGEQARRCRRFGDALARRTGLPVLYHDETLSSVDAAVAAATAVPAGGPRRPRPLDDRAAANILQSYLDLQERLR